MKSMTLAQVPFLLAIVAAKKGTQSVCLGPRPHLVDYDFVGENLQEIENATISIHPDYESNALCSAQPHGDKTMCVGANVDPSCASAAKDITFDSHVDCPSCFAGLTTDLFYSFKVKFFELEEVEVGLRNSHLRGAAEVHAQAEKSFNLPGKVPLIHDQALFKAGFMVADIIPVDIEVSVPTTFNYNLGIEGSVAATAGADVDVNLGDHYVKYQKGSGFSVVNGKPSYKFTPKLNVDVEADATLTLGLDSAVTVAVDKVVSYDVHLQPSFPLKVDLENQDKEVCVGGGVDFRVSHEADVHFTLFGKKHDIAHYGPKELYHYHNDVFKKCIDLKKNATIVV